MVATAPVASRRRARRDIRTAEPKRRSPAEVQPARRRRLHDRLEDWLAGYPDSPPVRLLHRAPMVLWRLGLGRFAGDQLLTTTGRKSGSPRRAPLSAHYLDGRLYAWDPYGERAHWYRNLVADPIVTVQDGRGTWTARAVHPTDRDEAMALYELVGRAIGRRFHEYLADAGIEDTAAGFADAIERIHAVRFDPVSQPGPPPLKADLAWVWPTAAGAALIWWLVRQRRSSLGDPVREP